LAGRHNHENQAKDHKGANNPRSRFEGTRIVVMNAAFVEAAVVGASGIEYAAAIECSIYYTNLLERKL
jgi:hypothetical protein